MGAGFWILIAVAAVFLLFILPVLAMSFAIYSVLLIRSKPDKWGRVCSFPEDEEYVGMYEKGLLWGEKYKDNKTPVNVKSGRFNLAGEYFDFGFDKAVIIIAGRTECCYYSYYFAEPYRDAGYNVLVLDNRAHGLSDGRINSLGYKEYKDIIAWSDMLHEKGNKSVVLHGICIGASTALFTVTAKNCPDHITAMVSDGMYVNFYESFKNHMAEKNKPNFPMTYGVMTHIFFISGANVVTDGPIKRIRKMKKPILMLQSKEDTYSLPELAVKLYDACPSEHKKLVYFDRGAHSRIRINDEEGYDATVKEFLKTL
jgi:alpha-beta hydrolase superfamily lysophospholipase